MRSYANLNKRIAKRYEKWMIALHYAPPTRWVYRKSVRMFIEFLGKKSISSVTHLDVRKFATQVSEDGASLNTTYRHLGVLRVFYDFLNLGGVVSYVAPRFVKIRKPVHNPPPALSERNVQRLISATRTLRERALVEFLYGTGCRLSETRKLQVHDIDFVARTARVLGKFGKVREVLLTKSAAEAIRVYVGDRQKGFVFDRDIAVQKGTLAVVGGGYWYAKWVDYGGPGPKYPKTCKYLGKAGEVSYESAKKKFETLLENVNLVRPKNPEPLSKMAVYNIIQRVGARAGLKGVSPHMLRRSFATHLYDRGATLEVIQALLGHVYIDTTRKYTRLSASRLVKTFERCHPLGKMNDPARQNSR
jgi:integrase/recombinase XerD